MAYLTQFCAHVSDTGCNNVIDVRPSPELRLILCAACAEQLQAELTPERPRKRL